MAEQLTMPKLGFDMAEGTLVNWTKKIGDKINKGDVVAEIETDKATIEIEAQAGGTLLEFLVQPGDVVPVGAPIALVGAEGEQVAEAEKPTPEKGTPPAGAPLDKATGATLTRHPEGAAEAERLGQPGPTPPKTPEQLTGTQPPLPVQEGGQISGDGGFPGGIKASPIARRLAEDKGIDLRRVKGTGPGGRVVKKDIEDFPVEEAPAAPVQPAEAPAAAPRPETRAPLPAPALGPLPSGPDVEIEDITRLRRRIGQRMVESQQQVPHFYVTMDIDVTALLDLRKQLNAAITDEARKISVNDLIVKAAALTLRQFPNLNSHYYGDKIARYKRIHIGIAVALPGGLINVVARDADRTALGTMAATNREMIARAREGKVKPDEIEGSTFSVSNLGPYDVDQFAAIINPPEAGILAIGAAKKVPVVQEDGSIGVGMRMKATISVDHRVSDGAEAAEFMKAFKDLIEQPMRLLM